MKGGLTASAIMKKENDTIVDLEEMIHAKKGGVSFVEIRTFLQNKGMDTKGEMALYLDSLGNCVLWTGMSSDFVEVINALRKRGKVTPKPCSTLVYWVDGTVLNLPIAKRGIQYKTLHWLPVVFDPTPISHK